MPVLDFKEIPVPTGGAARDQFEFFAREFLELIGFKTIVGPDRGPDGGRDLIVEEVRVGVVGETQLKWLVSCKHKAHSGASVTPEDERDIHDRVRTHKCDGFLGFYSTIQSAGLVTKLNATELPFEVRVYDPEKIEKILLTPTGLDLAKRFFPKSITKWHSEHPSPSKLFRDEPSLLCLKCSKNLLSPEPHGIVVVWHTIGDAKRHRKMHTEHVYWCCKGSCDKLLVNNFRSPGLVDGWEDIKDLIAPVAYIRWVMSMLNQIQGGVTYSPEAFKQSKELLLGLSPLVFRNVTEREKKRIEELSVIPSYLGGWGYDD